MKDRFGLPLNIDDVVFYLSKEKNWSGVTKIVKFTPKRVTILDPWMRIFRLYANSTCG